MKTSLSYLPQIKQDQILQVVDIIKEIANPEKIILFGSYATGTWVEDKYFENGTNYEYISDYDFLIVTKNRVEKEYDILDKILNQSRNLFRTPVNAIIHDVSYVNEGLEIGQYFFTDIVKEGILLQDNNSINFSAPRQLSSSEMKIIGQRYFDKWFASAFNFVRFANDAFNTLLLEKKPLNDAAFLLHQACEKLYNTILLVFKSYKPKTHNLEKLRQYSKPLSEEIFSIFPFPVDDKFETHLFDLLKRGYIDARYKDDYIITESEFRELLSRVKRMEEIVERISVERIKSFKD
ncbi:HEPN domain-containing protein [Ferruginibacter paludis]|uniref:HEPN domain-containing protein n=1 Tax=Ferruginibacter paludis TaxID=1310417 RepID=UPI0025B29A7A|nr:HEPN domain-containing protein [Ferruginibacter paludis]MDN3654054.1 HEPN domain-containing protein [Ferruginibacter paludis]